ncbi:cell division ATP-binding protein FtsE [Kurthia populi]|uniref:Cell division ATP-binding protein FtsE n=1 Tax=Kurthia populi TaxID=1562132 RepID=A0ABW5Y606_9BACL|nr:cell division ATP-binding protein FtsE [Kurthia sp. Dielmo]HIX41688.1 cell division ATP-binding protein FtsE [Candidatus Kurthia intestinigallinarum]
MIEMKQVFKKYPGGSKALQGLNVSIAQGEFVYVVGPSGAGKSTFIKMLYAEERASAGKVLVNQVDVTKLSARKVPFLRRQLGVVFQDYKLLPKKSVYENVAYALEVIEKDQKFIKQRVTEVLKLVGLATKAKRFPHELSGGEQQRVAIARAIVNQPKIVIADEPTGNLDPTTTWEVMKVLEAINAQGTTVIMATHNREVVDGMRHRVVRIEKGRIVSDRAGGDYNGY